MRELNQLPSYAHQMVRTLLETEILCQDLSGFGQRSMANQIAQDGRPTVLRFDGKSVTGKLSGTEARIFLVLKDEKAQATLFQPRVDVKVKRSEGDENRLLQAFKEAGIDGFEPRQKGPRPEGDAIIQVELPFEVEAADFASVLPWYVTWTTRAIIGGRAAFLAGAIAGKRA